MAQATVVNPKTGERKSVNVGDPNAFAGGFQLEQKIASPSDVSKYTVTNKDANSLYGVLKTPSNPVIPNVPANIDSSAISTGMNNSGISNRLPDTSATQNAIDIYTQRSQQDAETRQKDAQTQLDKISASQLQTTSNDKTAAEQSLQSTMDKRASDLAAYDARVAPLEQAGTAEYGRMLDSLKQIDYTDLVKKRVELTDDIVNYSKLMREQIDTSASLPAIQSISSGRSTAIQQGYLSKISTSQAALSAIDGNFNLAFDIMDKGANTIKALSTDRISFINFLNGVYGDEITYKQGKVTTLTQDEKDQLNALKTKLEADVKLVDENKSKMQDYMSNPDTAYIAQKAGLTLLDTPSQAATKLNKFFANNPQYMTANRTAVSSLMTKYPDAGITALDTIQAASDKITQKSKIYKKEIKDATNTLSPKDLIEVAQKLVDNGQATDINDAIQQIQNGLGGGTSNLGDQVGTILGLPSYDTESNNPGVNRPNRNNNPGNIKITNYSKTFPGVIGAESKPAVDGGNFLIFDSPESGIAAIGKLISEATVYNGMTAEQAIKKYNNNGSYGAIDVGLNPNQDFKSQIKDSAKLQEVATAIAKQEGFKGSSVNVDTPEVKSIKDSLSAILPRLTAEQKKSANALVNGALRTGDVDGAREAIATTAISALPAEQQNKSFGRLIAIDALRDIQTSLLLFQQKGGDTNIFSGTTENILQKVGETSNPELAQIGNKIALSMIAYRNAVSGAAFTESEAKAYEKIFPSTLAGGELNNARIASLISTFNLNQKSTLSTVIGNKNYDGIFGNNSNILSDSEANRILSEMAGLANPTNTPTKQGQSSAYIIYPKLSNPYQK